MPPIDRAALPADVRDAPADVRARYQAALSFERQLTAVLATQLESTAGESLGGAYGQLLPDALADSITAGGGLGLARGLAGLDTTGRSAA